MGHGNDCVSLEIRPAAETAVNVYRRLDADESHWSCFVAFSISIGRWLCISPNESDGFPEEVQ